MDNPRLMPGRRQTPLKTFGPLLRITARHPQSGEIIIHKSSGPAHEGKVAQSEGEQMPGGLRPAAKIVRHHTGKGAVQTFRAQIHHRNARFLPGRGFGPGITKNNQPIPAPVFVDDHGGQFAAAVHRRFDDPGFVGAPEFQDPIKNDPLITDPGRQSHADTPQRSRGKGGRMFWNLHGKQHDRGDRLHRPGTSDDGIFLSNLTPGWRF